MIHFFQVSNDVLLWFSTSQQQRTMQLLHHPSPHWGEEEKGKKKAKLVGWDKDVLTEQQTKRTVTTTILVRRIYKTK